MRRIQLVKLTGKNDHGYANLMSQNAPLKIKEFALRANNQTPIPVMTDESKGFTLGYLVDDTLYGVANFTIGTDKKKRPAGVIEGMSIWREGHRYMIAERMLISLVRMIPEEYPETSQVELYVAAADDAAIRLYGRLGFTSTDSKKKVRYGINFTDNNELMVLYFKKRN